MIELWRNGVLIGYFKIPNTYDNTIDFAIEYNRDSIPGDVMAIPLTTFGVSNV